ncbi:oligopeptidase A [Candidatus Schneideria nysicola]|uniref:oligopeptidase A n=1 Tax=Candidatus Schneideria nysicola TaxID=1081631 RepID=UPI001CAA54CB|nr:oligopeptidase A [Candidatus Schneideria nysicola]UAJ65938.1 oligopeptidase A [Candidatus Schneideria nysicola]
MPNLLPTQCNLPLKLPCFSKISYKDIVNIVKQAIDHCYKTVEEVTSNNKNFTWENLCQPISESNNDLNYIWSFINHMNAVKNSPDLRKAYEESLLLLSEYTTWISHHNGLYQSYCILQNNVDIFNKLNVAQKKLITNIIRDFELSGTNLSKSQKNSYKRIVTRLSELAFMYSNNVLDSTMGWNKLITNRKELAGLPKSTLSLAYNTAIRNNKKGWLITLDTPIYLSILTYCENSSLREEIYYAYNTRASDQGPNAGRWDNGPLINEILSLRYEIAQLLGFNSYADKSLVTKMACDKNHVINFLLNLIKHTKDKGKKEFLQLCTFVKNYFNCDLIHPWDIAFYSEKQKQHYFAINDEQFRPFFPEKKVLSGLFKITQLLYCISIKERKEVDRWDPDVRFFEIFDKNGQLRGGFYLDLYARMNKRDGAWMESCTDMFIKSDGTLQKPVAYLVCNFNPPIENKKTALFTHSEVITLFHEFGHGLHHIMTSIDILGVSGTDGIPWDAIEISSQFMENFCWTEQALSLISGHYKDDSPIPSSLLKQLLYTRTYQSSLFLLRQLELSLFDFRLHCQNNLQDNYYLKLLESVKKEVSVLPTVEWSRFPNTFSHIFSGGYAAGYYSYLWSNVLSSDAWSLFEEKGIFNPDVGQSFLDNILSCGGSEDPSVLFYRFRGRDPNINAMLRHYNIIENDNIEENIKLDKF